MPWANGLGSTLELAVEPPGAPMPEIDWRISIATVSEPGPFSHLPGIDRVLLVLDDVEAELTVDGRAVSMHRLDQVAFSGDANVALTSVSATAHDLNLMTRRGRWTGRMRVHDLAIGISGDPAPGALTWLLIVNGAARAVDGSATERLGDLDLVLLDRTTHVVGEGTAVVLELARAERESSWPRR